MIPYTTAKTNICIYLNLKNITIRSYFLENLLDVITVHLKLTYWVCLVLCSNMTSLGDLETTTTSAENGSNQTTPTFECHALATKTGMLKFWTRGSENFEKRSLLLGLHLPGTVSSRKDIFREYYLPRLVSSRIDILPELFLPGMVSSRKGILLEMYILETPKEELISKISLSFLLGSKIITINLISEAEIS